MCAYDGAMAFHRFSFPSDSEDISLEGQISEVAGRLYGFGRKVHADVNFG